MSRRFYSLKILRLARGNMIWKGLVAVSVLVATALAPTALAATSNPDLEVELELNRTQIELGEHASLKVTVTGSGDSTEPVIPDVDGLDITSQGRAQSVQIIDMQVKSSRIFTYMVEPRKLGEFTIGPAEIDREGKVFKSDTVHLSVVEPSKSQASTTEQGGNVIVEASVSNSTPYIGQQIALLFRFARKAGGGVGNASYELPSLSNFWNEGVESRREYAQKIRGSDYLVTEVAVPIFPIVEGNITIGAIALHYDQLAASDGSRSDVPFFNDPFAKNFFDDDFFKMFRGGNVEKRTAYTGPIRVYVRPLPAENKPNEFKGGVGNFSMTARLSGDEVKVGESVTLTLTLSGEGNIRDMSDPNLQVEGAKLYTDTPSIDVKNYHDTIVGEKVYRLAIVPQRAGEIDVPKLSIPYFNPSTARYEFASAGPLKLKALPSEKEGPEPLEPAGRNRVAEAQPNQDILPIHERIGPIKACRTELWLRRLRPVAYSLPLAVYALCFVLVKHKERLRTDIAYRRYKYAVKTADTCIKDAHAAMSQKRWDEVFGKCSRAVTEYLADKLNVPAGGLTPADIRSALLSRGVSDKVLAETIEFLEACDYGRFASSRKGPQIAGECIRRAQYVIDRLEEEEAIKR